jgi:hypothetical protein
MAIIASRFVSALLNQHASPRVGIHRCGCIWLIGLTRCLADESADLSDMHTICSFIRVDWISTHGTLCSDPANSQLERPRVRGRFSQLLGCIRGADLGG